MVVHVGIWSPLLAIVDTPVGNELIGANMDLESRLIAPILESSRIKESRFFHAERTTKEKTRAWNRQGFVR
jgi:hypothetical protein